MFIADNTLAPPVPLLTLPWARSDRPGCADGGNRYDLERWNPAYFARLRAFVAAAREREIVVELCFFNCQYEESWPVSPFRLGNNVQGIGPWPLNDFQTTRHPEWFTLQKAYVRKITREVNEFDNVILEIIDEPTLKGTPANLANEWISGLVDAIIEEEAGLPNKHLIGQQLQPPIDFSDDPRVPVLVTQYIHIDGNMQTGGVEALDWEYAHGRPIEVNETAYFPIWYRGDVIAASRVEAWEFLVGGGAGFNQLNGFFTARNPSGDDPLNLKALEQLRVLRAFMEGFDFVKMRLDRGFVVLKEDLPRDIRIRATSEPGRQYAVYLHHSAIDVTCYTVLPADRTVELTLEMPGGRYRADWVEPETGKVLAAQTLDHADGRVKLTSPRYSVDLALRVVRMD